MGHTIKEKIKLLLGLADGIRAQRIGRDTGRGLTDDRLAESCIASREHSGRRAICLQASAATANE